MKRKYKIQIDDRLERIDWAIAKLRTDIDERLDKIEQRLGKLEQAIDDIRREGKNNDSVPSLLREWMLGEEKDGDN